MKPTPRFHLRLTKAHGIMPSAFRCCASVRAASMMGTLALALLLLPACTGGKETAAGAPADSASAASRSATESGSSAPGERAPATLSRPASGLAGEAAHAGASSTSPDWCAAHAVPESLCTRCNPMLIPAFQAKGDWCKEHGVPESQCTLCHPELIAAFQKMAPVESRAAAAEAGATDAVPAPGRQAGKGAPEQGRGAAYEGVRVRLATPETASKAGIRSELVTEDAIELFVSAPVRLAFDATRAARISSPVTGIVRELRVAPGSRLLARAPVLVVASPELSEAAARLRDAEAARTLARQTVEREERLVALKVSARKDLLEAARELQAAEAAVAGARGVLGALGAANTSGETGTSGASRAGDSAPRERAGAQHGVDGAPGAGDATGARKGASSSDADGTPSLEARLAGAPNGPSAPPAEPFAGVLDASGQLVLRTPLAGVVTRVAAAVGQAVTTDMVLVEVNDPGHLWAELDLAEGDAPLVREGDTIALSFPSLPAPAIAGTIVWLASEIDPGSRTVRARAQVSNREGWLRGGMLGTARVHLAARRGVSVPAEAIQDAPEGPLAFVQKSAQLYEPRALRLGSARDGRVEVLAGLRAGERVVTQGSFLLKTEIMKGSLGAGCCDAVEK